MEIVDVEQMRRIEAASDAAGHSYAAMMELAGRGVAQAIIARRPVHGRRVLVLVGPGNNGGDGLVAARLLAQAGADVVCYLLKPRDPLEDVNFRLVQSLGLAVALAPEDEDLQRLLAEAQRAHIVVDALLGTGTRLPVRGVVADVLGQLRAGLALGKRQRCDGLVWLAGTASAEPQGAPLIVAVDGPTGLDFDSGALDPSALPADLTVTFAYPKVGHFRFPGAGALGELVVVDIGTDPSLAAGIEPHVATGEMVRHLLPPRLPSAHKGTFGKALIVAGSQRYTGAAYLAGAAATRAGAGLVTLAVPSCIHTPVASRLAEATYLPLPHEDGAIAVSAANVVTQALGDYDALLVGPGLGRPAGVVAFVRELLARCADRADRPFALVVDADGLNILAELADWPQRLPPGSILTPHPGEMARLMASELGSVQRDRLAAARTQAAAWGHVVVLKGAYTVVAAPDGRVVIQPFASAALATAGTGDVLAGTIVALKAQGLSPFDAAVAGSYLHGVAGVQAGVDQGEAGTVASDLIDRLPSAWRRISNG
ncbi:MAG: NAD(P)H-hydrate dehydratase [Anaerolineales bacterium]|nr:NAD(P)H-hydrate dehydratase [Anaerolineales bacterium]